jgi:hypothetical protein
MFNELFSKGNSRGGCCRPQQSKDPRFCGVYPSFAVCLRRVASREEGISRELCLFEPSCAEQVHFHGKDHRAVAIPLVEALSPEEKIL